MIQKKLVDSLLRSSFDRATLIIQKLALVRGVKYKNKLVAAVIDRAHEVK